MNESKSETGTSITSDNSNFIFHVVSLISPLRSNQQGVPTPTSPCAPHGSLFPY